ncbi:MAG: response regulator transcription factor [Microvirga sp.]
MPPVPTISIIDDDASIRVSTSRLVRALGYCAHTFASADEFLSSCRVADTGCIISDVQMPGTSGIELQSILNEQGRSLPIIFITAYPEEIIRDRALANGAVAFLGKPFDGSRIAEHIDRALQKHGEGAFEA